MRILKTKQELIDVSKLHICKVYQRTEKKAQIRKIVENFNMDALGTLLVAYRHAGGGKYYVVDGQQRLAALKQMGVKKAPCGVFDSQGVDHEALVFKEVNKDRATVGPGPLFHALLAAKDKDALAIKKALAKYDLTLYLKGVPDQHGSANAYGTIHAVSTLQKLQGWGVLDRTLETITKAWKDDADAMSGTVLEGVGIVWNVVGDQISTRTLVNKLKTTTARKVLAAGLSLQGLYGGGRAKCIARAIVVHYNKGKRDANKLEEIS